MTWKELYDEIGRMSEKYLNEDAFFHCSDCDDFYLVAVSLPEERSYIASDEPYLIDQDLSERDDYDVETT